MSFNPNTVEPVPEAGTVYRPFRLSDRWGVLDADSSGALVNASFSAGAWLNRRRGERPRLAAHLNAGWWT